MTVDPVNPGDRAPDPGSDGQTSLGRLALAWLQDNTRGLPGSDGKEVLHPPSTPTGSPGLEPPP